MFLRGNGDLCVTVGQKMALATAERAKFSTPAETQGQKVSSSMGPRIGGYLRTAAEPGFVLQRETAPLTSTAHPVFDFRSLRTPDPTGSNGPGRSGFSAALRRHRKRLTDWVRRWRSLSSLQSCSVSYCSVESCSCSNALNDPKPYWWLSNQPCAERNQACAAVT